MNDEPYVLVQYSRPPVWMEWGAYLCTVLVFAAAVVTGALHFVAVLAGCLLYWNYLLFSTLKNYVQYRNASEFSKMLTALNEHEANNTQDGTIPVQQGLTKESEDETDS